MVFVTPAKTTNANPKARNLYHIGGIQVEFPYQPYGTQLAFMGRVISTLDRAQRDGHCHALLESPTGTGKSLSLLCSILAWQQNFKIKNQYANLTQSKPNPEAIMDPLAHGGGFIPETPSSEPSQAPVSGKNQKKKVAPTIYYASRTHSQISQVVREFRKTAYRVPMAILASRKHYCTNAHVNGKENLDEECKLLLRDGDGGCSHFKNANKVRAHPSLQKGGCHEVHDIEDLVRIGQVVKGCPYYAATSMAGDAQLVFCPYNYLINPIIRGAMDVDIKGAILVFDEAHNIEDIARDAGSVNIDDEVLHKLQLELGQLCALNPMIYQPLHEMAQGLESWIEQRKYSLEKHGFQHYFSCWTGDRALKELQEANISQQCFPILLECATKAIKAATDTESEAAHLSGMSVIVLEGLFASLTYLFSRNGCHISDYQLALQRSVRKDRRNAVGGWKNTLSLWCLNPAVVFKDIANLSLSVILTSGTLSPMNSFSSELGVQFGTCLEAPHAIDVEAQVWAAVVSTGVDNYPLNASYKTADGYAFQDALGKSLEEIFKIVPAGSLVFFPSYKLMEKLCNRWQETGQWSRLNARKSIFVEPRGGSQEDFDSILKGYYDSITLGNRPAVGRKRRVKRVDLNDLKATESTESFKKDGAAFLAVCRGKISEGIDFSGDNARVVIVVGIPFPNINDIQVGLKKKYNDTYKASKNLLSGSEWYCHQAFRALNQAIGRCIRHRFDYGAIILLDERYQEERNRGDISKWLRKSVQQYDSINTALEGLKSFFSDVKANVDKKMVDLSPNSHVNGENNIPFKDQSRGCRRNTNQKLNKSDHCGHKPVSLTKGDATSKLKSQRDVQIEEYSDSCKEIIDLECDLQKDSRRFEISPHEDPEIIVVKETPGVGGSGTISPGSFSKDGNSSSTVIHASVDCVDQASFYSLPPTNSTKAPQECENSMELTPDKEFTINSRRQISEAESCVTLSVNSHILKRRKSLSLTSVRLFEEQSDAPNDQIPCSVGCARSSIASRDADCRIESDFGTNYADCPSNKLSGPQLLPMDNHASSSLSLDHVKDKSLQISCSICKSPLGLPENHLYVRCTYALSSKVHLVSLVKERLNCCTENMSACVPVLITDISSVSKHLYNNSLEGAPGPGQGVWSEEDGCVFSSIFCPFCSNSNCLGVLIKATDASNVQLINKLLLYVNHLEIRNPEAPGESKDKDLLTVNGPCMDKIAALNSFDRFAYSPTQNSGGWRSTKLKMRMPKRGLPSDGHG